MDVIPPSHATTIDVNACVTSPAESTPSTENLAMLRNDLAETLSLNGIWSFRLGEDQTWSTIQVPGCWEAQGYSKSCEGPAVYRRYVEVPQSWAGRRIQLEFDAVSYFCALTINHLPVGSHRGMWTPFSFDVTNFISPGVNLIELVVFKPGERYPLRSTLSGFLPDVALAFGGIWQGVRLRAMKAAFSDLQVTAEPENRIIHLSGKAHIFESRRSDLVRCRIKSDSRIFVEQDISLNDDGGWNGNVYVPDARLWHPGHPVLYNIDVELFVEGTPLASVKERTGFRHLKAEGEQLLLNHRPICLRGVLHWGWDPDLIAPAFSDEQIRREFRAIRELGFNLIKLCLFVPNRRYYEIADEEGVLLWQEWPMWQPKLTEELRTVLVEEYAAYMRLAAHHPSIAIYSVGCELDESVDAEILTQLTLLMRRAASGALVCDNSGTAEAYGGAELDLADFYDYHTYTDLHFFEPMLDHWRRDWRTPRPWIFGEFNDSDNYRDLNAIIAANEGKRPWWITEENPLHTSRPQVAALLAQLQRIEDADLGFTPEELTTLSRAQSLTVIKYILEAVRRRSGVGGYVVTGIRDTPINTSGVLDDFGNTKWSAAKLRQFNDDAILCLEVDRRRVWKNGGDRPDRLDMFNWRSGDIPRFHFVLHNTGEALSANAYFEWRIVDMDGNLQMGGSYPLPAEPWLGRPYKVATVQQELPGVVSPAEFRLNARICDGAREIENQWPLWIYPKLQHDAATFAVYDPNGCLSDWGELFAQESTIDLESCVELPSVLVVTTLTLRLLEYLRAGGKVLLIQQGCNPLPVRQVPFWRESIKLLYPHPIWSRFPHRGFTDLQFFGLATDFAFDTSRIKEFLRDLHLARPLLRRLDAREFHVTDYMIEIHIGRGRLVASTLRFQGGAGAQPSGLRRNVVGHYLLCEAIRYLAEG